MRNIVWMINVGKMLDFECSSRENMMTLILRYSRYILEMIYVSECFWNDQTQSKKSGLHQLIAGWHGHQVDALELSSVGKKSLGAGGQDVVARRRYLATLQKKTFTHVWSGGQTQRWWRGGRLTTEMMSFSFSKAVESCWRSHTTQHLNKAERQ